MTQIKLEGIACTWSTFHDPDFDCTEQYQPVAFSHWVTTDAAKWVPVQIDHLAEFRLPSRGALSWGVSEAGLHVAFEMDATTADGRAAMLAVRHGHLTALSIGSRRPIMTMVDNVRHVLSASVTELSLTADPKIPGTSIAIVGERPACSKSMPANAADRSLLLTFLAELDYPTEIPAPRPAKTAPVAPQKQPAASAAVSRPITKSPAVQTWEHRIRETLAAPAALGDHSAWFLPCRPAQ